MQDHVLIDLRVKMREILNAKLSLGAKELIALTNALVKEVIPAVDTEVSFIVEACGLAETEDGADLI